MYIIVFTYVKKGFSIDKFIFVFSAAKCGTCHNYSSSFKGMGLQKLSN